MHAVGNGHEIVLFQNGDGEVIDWICNHDGCVYSKPDLDSELSLSNYMGIDGMRWAEQFVRLHGGDVGLMHSWFANAIEAGRDSVTNEKNGDL